ncbi:MAG: hypothetical protein MZU97_09590 [Bacillus subtilis]|nr:hypothetical protein [Bacillus subtilis]
MNSWTSELAGLLDSSRLQFDERRNRRASEKMSTARRNSSSATSLTCIPHPDSDHLHVTTVDVGRRNPADRLRRAERGRRPEASSSPLKAPSFRGTLKIKKSKIRGVESNGMICSLDELGIDHKYHQEDGIHVLLRAPIAAAPTRSVALCFDDEVIETRTYAQPRRPAR